MKKLTSQNKIKEHCNSFFNKIRENKNAFFVLLCTFVALLGITFLDVTSRETVATFALSEYQIGQIADRTIVAEKSLPALDYDPITVTKGEKIIRKGFPITEENYAKLRKIAEAKVYIDFRALANAILYLFLLVVLSTFLFSPYMLGRKIKVKEMIFIAVMYTFVYGVTTFATKVPVFLSQYALPTIIPATFATILITLLFSQVSAVFFSILISLGVLFITSFQPIPFLFILSSSIAAAIVVEKNDHRIDMVFSSIILSILNIVFMFALSIIVNVDSGFKAFSLFGVALNAFISGIFALGFLTPLESWFNTASIFRLMDLSDTNNKIMKHLIFNASGTYHHSIMVATLAESACRKIGANPILARVGAYYHDIGKIDKPLYFSENQSDENKHDDINPSMSVSVIKSHVKNGVELARQEKLPEEVIDIIAQHHGNSVISCFYDKAKKIDDNATEEQYRYSGENPTTKEAAVVMLADTVEAACKSMSNHSVPAMRKLVHQLIMDKVEHRLLDNCPLRFCDLTVIEDDFVDTLAGFYHSRIVYPNQVTEDDSDDKTSEENSQKKDSDEK